MMLQLTPYMCNRHSDRQTDGQTVDRKVTCQPAYASGTTNRVTVSVTVAIKFQINGLNHKKEL